MNRKLLVLGLIVLYLSWFSELKMKQLNSQVMQSSSQGHNFSKSTQEDQDKQLRDRIKSYQKFVNSRRTSVRNNHEYAPARKPTFTDDDYIVKQKPMTRSSSITDLFSQLKRRDSTRQPTKDERNSQAFKRTGSFQNLFKTRQNKKSSKLRSSSTRLNLLGRKKPQSTYIPFQIRPEQDFHLDQLSIDPQQLQTQQQILTHQNQQRLQILNQTNRLNKQPSIQKIMQQKNKNKHKQQKKNNQTKQDRMQKQHHSSKDNSSRRIQRQKHLQKDKSQLRQKIRKQSQNERGHQHSNHSSNERKHRSRQTSKERKHRNRNHSSNEKEHRNRNHSSNERKHRNRNHSSNERKHRNRNHSSKERRHRNGNHSSHERRRLSLNHSSEKKYHRSPNDSSIDIKSPMKIKSSLSRPTSNQNVSQHFSPKGQSRIQKNPINKTRQFLIKTSHSSPTSLKGQNQVKNQMSNSQAFSSKKLYQLVQSVGQKAKKKQQQKKILRQQPPNFIRPSTIKDTPLSTSDRIRKSFKKIGRLGFSFSKAKKQKIYPSDKQEKNKQILNQAPSKQKLLLSKQHLFTPNGNPKWNNHKSKNNFTKIKFSAYSSSTIRSVFQRYKQYKIYGYSGQSTQFDQRLQQLKLTSQRQLSKLKKASNKNDRNRLQNKLRQLKQQMQKLITQKQEQQQLYKRVLKVDQQQTKAQQQLTFSQQDLGLYKQILQQNLQRINSKDKNHLTQQQQLQVALLFLFCSKQNNRVQANAKTQYGHENDARYQNIDPFDSQNDELNENKPTLKSRSSNSQNDEQNQITQKRISSASSLSQDDLQDLSKSLLLQMKANRSFVKRKVSTSSPTQSAPTSIKSFS